MKMASKASSSTTHTSFSNPTSFHLAYITPTHICRHHHRRHHQFKWPTQTITPILTHPCCSMVAATASRPRVLVWTVVARWSMSLVMEVLGVINPMKIGPEGADDWVSVCLMFCVKMIIIIITIILSTTQIPKHYSSYYFACVRWCSKIDVVVQ